MHQLTKVNIRKLLRADQLIPLVLVIIFWFIYATYSLLRHMHFQSHGFDLGIFDQAIWHYSRFQAPASTIRDIGNLLGDHFHPILILLAPGFWIWNNVDWLLVAQAGLFATSIWPVYRFTHRKLGPIPAICFSIAYGLYWGIQNAIAFDFHEIAFAVPAIAFAINYFDQRRWRPFVICMLVLMLTKEDLSLVIGAFGVLLLTYRLWRGGLALLIGGIAWFFVTTKLLIPFFAGNVAYGYWTFTQLGPTPLSALGKIITDPLLVISIIRRPRIKLLTLKMMFSPFLGLSIFSPLIILAVPLLAERFLSTNPNYWTSDFHYTATVAPILAMAAADGLANLAKWSNRFTKKPVLAKWGILAASILILTLSLYHAPRYPLRSLGRLSFWTTSPSDRQGNQMLRLIPSDATVAAQDTIAPHLTHRAVIYNLTPSDPRATYLAANFAMAHFPTDDATYSTYLKSLTTHDYGVIYSQGSWILFEQGAKSVPLSPAAKTFLAD